jgi:uncharacterized protein YggE
VHDVKGIRSLGRADVLAIVALAVALAAGGYALSSSQSGVASGTVSVSGSGTATERPDTLTVTMSVRTVAPSTKAALTRVNTEASAVEQAFFSAGVAKKDVQTSNLSVGEQDDQSGKKIGYAAQLDLTVVLRVLSKSGAVVNAAQSAAGNDVSITGITYSITDVSKGERTARAAAMRDALARAKALAGAAGESIGPILKITDNSNAPIPLPFAQKSASASSGSPTSVPLQPGTETSTANVDVVFSLVR